jgi:hypothetical protein
VIPSAPTSKPDSERLRARIIVGRLATGWILEKFARRLVEHLPAFGVEAEQGPEPSRDVDINHWVLYHEVTAPKHGLTTVLITHVDDPLKLSLLKRDLDRNVDAGVCFSRNTLAQLVRAGLRPGQLCFVTPAHDGLVEPRRLVIGITSRLYPDMRKREHLLLQLAGAVRLDRFHFSLFGQGWERIAPHLEQAGATVHHQLDTGDYARDYAAIVKAIPHFDYFLYTGMDEGSLGLLDALAAGVPTIATPQGFHLDLPDGLTYPFQSGDDLIAVFARISAIRQPRIDAVRPLTWMRYAESHALLWRILRRGGTATDFDAEYRRSGPEPAWPSLVESGPASQGSPGPNYYRSLSDPSRWRLYLRRRYPSLVRLRDRLRRR